MYSCEFAKQY